MDLRLHDVLELKKEHPCGSKRWQVLRVGMDIKLRCLGCGHEVMQPRRKIEKNDTAHRAEGGIAMRPKWTRYFAMGIALLLAIVMAVTLVLPYLGL